MVALQCGQATEARLLQFIRPHHAEKGGRVRSRARPGVSGGSWGAGLDTAHPDFISAQAVPPD